jgi:putative endopeptidase
MCRSVVLVAGTAAIFGAVSLTAPLALASPMGGSGLNLAALDRSIKPGNDFFDYAVGTWYAHADMPADHSEIGLEQETSEKVHDQLQTLIERDASHPEDANARLIGALYKSYVDEQRIDALEAKPLQPDLAEIAAVHDRSGIARLMGESWSNFSRDAFTLLIQPDAHRPFNALSIGQGGLGLPSRDYYLSSEFSKQRDAYQAYAARTLRMVGVEKPDEAARSIIQFETRIAKVSWDESEQRQVDKTYNPMSVAQLEAYAPGLDWRSYLRGAGASRQNRVTIAEKTAVRDIAQIVRQTPLTTLKLWETFHTVDNASPFLSKRFAQNYFDFHNRDLFGATAMRPRQARAISQVDQSLGDAVGHQYAASYFPQASKARIEAMVAELKSAMAVRIRAASWMSDGTRTEALNKLTRMKVLVGYPSHWRDYSGLRLSPTDLYGNIRRITGFDWAFQAATLGKAVDRDEWGPFYWGIHPQTVDAFNIASENKIIFPAALLQPPEFDAAADAAVNYGGMGAVIGHEISHGFDDQGRKIDAFGRLRDWWTAKDAARYRAGADKLVEQVNSYEILPGVHLNGRQTLGENIADLAGLLVALDAYHASLDGKPSPVVDGLTGDQRLFLAWAQKWRRKNRDEALRAQAALDTHSPARFRAIGAVRNVDAWYRAFNVQPGDRYYLPPEKRARIW